jgi:hypothetical protein
MRAHGLMRWRQRRMRSRNTLLFNLFLVIQLLLNV